MCLMIGYNDLKCLMRLLRRDILFSVLRQLAVRYFLVPICYIFVILIMCRKVTISSSITFIDDNAFSCMHSDYQYYKLKQSISDNINFMKIEKMIYMTV